MPEIPRGAMNAAVAAIEERCAQNDGAARWHAVVALEAAVPILAEQERRKCSAHLRRAAAGRREYASRELADEATTLLLGSATAFEHAAELLEDPARILDVIPAWRWTDRERASLRGQDHTQGVPDGRPQP